MAILITEDRWMLQVGGKLDPGDEKVIADASQDGPVQIVTIAQALEIMEKREPGKFADFRSLMESQNPAGVPLTTEQIVSLAFHGDARMQEFDKSCERFMNEAVARQIRVWRVDDHYTWRAIARKVYSPFWYWWRPSSNQLAGMSLCKRAAVLLGEDYLKYPWN